MGFKTLMFLIVIIIMSLFFVQNLESISLVFLGFNSLSLPLSFWIILALFSGILSSLIIQVLSSNSMPKTKPNQSFSPNKNIPDNPPNSPIYNPIYNPPSVKSSFADKPIAEKQTFSAQPIYAKNSLQNNPPDELDKEFDFDDIPENTYENNQLLDKNNQPNFTINNIDINPPLETESIPSIEITSETEFTPSSLEDIPLEKILKPREASIYSYQSREKTDIKPKLSTPKLSKQKQSLPNNRDNKFKGGIYDAPYRVISPADDNNQQDIDNNFDDDEDWDF